MESKMILFIQIIIILAKYIASVAPWFTYTSICLNHNLKCIPHTDNKNVGGSIIVGFGNYSQGELCTNEESYNINYNPLYSIGYNTLHWNSEWSGDRWTATFYTI